MTHAEPLRELSTPPDGHGTNFHDTPLERPGKIRPGQRGGCLGRSPTQGPGMVANLLCATHLVHDGLHGMCEAPLLEPTLPHHDDGPARSHEQLAVLAIARTIAGKLGLPEGGVALGVWQGAVGTAMPEAAIDEDGHLATRIADVWLAGSLLPVEAVAGEARLAQSGTNLELGLGVL